MIKQKNQNGFSFIEYFIIFIVVSLISFASWFVYQKNEQQKSISKNIAINYAISFRSESDNNYNSQYKIDVFFYDSIVNTGCPSKIENFKGELSIQYSSEVQASVSVSQNIKPTKSDTNKISTLVCPAVVIPPQTESIMIDKAWIESGEESKTIQINDDEFELVLNKQTRIISLKGKSYDKTLPYLPDGIAQLYAAPWYQNCKTIDDLKSYAKENGITEAETKFPGLNKSLKDIPGLVLQAPDGSKNVLLVVANDSVKKLIEDTANEKGYDDNCRVVAIKPLYVFVLP